MEKFYTVFVNGRLWVNVIDDMNTTEIWAIGGMIFSSLKKVKAFIKHLKKYDEWENSKIEIKEITFN